MEQRLCSLCFEPETDLCRRVQADVAARVAEMQTDEHPVIEYESRPLPLDPLPQDSGAGSISLSWSGEAARISSVTIRIRAGRSLPA